MPTSSGDLSFTVFKNLKKAINQEMIILLITTVRIRLFNALFFASGIKIFV
jgi:hypothetical protein